MTKILFVCHNLATGGVQKALLQLLKELPPTDDVTLYVFNGDGMEQVPPRVRVIQGNKLIQLLGLSQREAWDKGVLLFLLRALCVGYTRLVNHRLPMWLLFRTVRLPRFDVAISFVHTPSEQAFYSGCHEFVLSRVTAAKKWAYVHCDFLRFGGNTAKNRALYRQFDRVIAVSPGCEQQLIQAIPALEGKVYCLENCIDYAEVRRSSEQPYPYLSGLFHIVTVCRLSEEKGLLRTLPVMASLLSQGQAFCWHIVGEGPQKKALQAKIASLGLQGVVQLHGEQTNPYAYMAGADLFLLPSYHEAAPLVLEEAKCAGVPVLATKTLAADLVAGWVCENDEESLEAALLHVLTHREELAKKRAELQALTLTNEARVQAWRELVYA